MVMMDEIIFSLALIPEYIQNIVSGNIQIANEIKNAVLRN